MKLDVTKHVLVPNHTKISQKAKEALLKKYNVSVIDLPRINKLDPAIKGLGVKMGDVIKIKRNSPTAKTHIFFKVVTDD